MSDLAHNLNGEPFEVPGAAVGWRVRKLKAKGAPEVVYGREGIPLVLPIDADMDDLRREARNEGRYRLDPIDEHSRPIPGCPAGYVCIHEGEPTVEPPPAAKPAPATADQAVVEAMRVNAELARAVIDKFPMMLESAAVLLRAADNAGMPRRLPHFLDVANDEGDDDDKAEDAPKATGLQGIIETVVSAAAPAIVNAVIGKIQIPGGLGALLDCRRAVPKDRASAAHATSTPGVVPAPGPSDPAPAPSAPSPSPDTPTEAHAQPAPAAAAADLPGDLPTLDPAALVHFANIQRALTFREGMLARAMAAELSPAELRAWLSELRPLSVPEAVAEIRAVLGPDASDSPNANGSSGASEPGASGSSGALGGGKS